MIHKPSEINQNQKYRALLYGNPGLRKSTTGLSAPSPLFVDTDKGWDRIDAKFRRADYIQPESYDEVLADLSGDLSAYESIVLDTGGALLEMMKAYVVKNGKGLGQSDGTLTIKGYGAVGREFNRFVNWIYYTLKKNVIVIFHSKEKSEGDITVNRVDVEGQTASNIWKSMDIGGFMEMRGNKYFISFSPSDRYFAKGTRGITGDFEIPTIESGDKNTFLSSIFAKFKDNAKTEAAMVKEYETLMGCVRNHIETITDANSANVELEYLKTVTHVFASKTESWTLLKQKAESIGLAFANGAFVVKEVKDE